MTAIDSRGSAAIDGIRVGALTLPAPGFEAFTFSRYHALLARAEEDPDRRRLAVGAWLGEEPAGLALFSRPLADGTERRLLSIRVSSRLRRQGLGSRLLAAGEALAAGQGARRLVAVHSSLMLERAAFEALLRKSGWSAPEACEQRFAGKAGWALQVLSDWAPFLARLQTRGYRGTPWSEVSAEDRQQIASIVLTQLSDAERGFDPCAAETKLPLVPELSLLLRRGAEIVGWILASRGAIASSIYYSHGYVLPVVQRAGWLLCGVRDVCQRQTERFGGETLSVLETSVANQRMRRFMQQKLEPYFEWTDTRYVSEKLLACSPKAVAAPC